MHASDHNIYLLHSLERSGTVDEAAQLQDVHVALNRHPAVLGGGELEDSRPVDDEARHYAPEGLVDAALATIPTAAHMDRRLAVEDYVLIACHEEKWRACLS